MLLSPPHAFAVERTLASATLADLTIEELTQIPITSVSRRPEPLATAPSAIQLITGEEIRRSSANLLPEALRLAPNLQVAQLTSNDWAITARGFSGAPSPAGSLSNKLLVMIDGRAIYSPVFGGVFWDVNNVLLEDIERIEAVSGPGGALWGANAVNGVINIIRKHAADTQGWYGSVAAGSEVEDYALRYGGRAGDQGYFRVYGQDLGREALAANGRDGWSMRQGGFRLDLDVSPRDSLTLQGDLYDGSEGVGNVRRGQRGSNLLGTWQRRYSDTSDLIVTAYIDHQSQDRVEIDFELDTYDLDLQHTFPLGDAVQIVWGANYRLMRDQTRNPTTADFVPPDSRMQNINGFVQSELALIPRRLALTLGAKLGDNEFSGFEVQPSARLAWTPSPGHMAWTAISRAVRSPSRFDVALVTTDLEGNPDFDSEKVIAYEVGYRAQPTRGSTVSMAAFYNDYYDVRSINVSSAPPPPLIIDNDFEARSWGVELSGMLAMADWWRVSAFYTYFDSDFTPQDPQVVPGAEIFEASDPKYQVAFHSMMDLPYELQFDLIARWVGSLPGGIPSYNTVDARLAWRTEHWELALIGQNLNGSQREFGNLDIPRSVFARTSFWY